jgi:GTPase involved in cell partitioning and DNA repair
MTFLLLLFAMALIFLMALPNVEKSKTIIRIPPAKPRNRASMWPFTDSRSMFG